MDFLCKALNFKKGHLLNFSKNKNVGSLTDDLQKYTQKLSDDLSIQDKIKAKIEKLEQWEITKAGSLERLSLLIDIIKAKQIEIHRKEMELLKKMRSQRTSVEIDEEKLSVDDNSKTIRKRKLKKSINRYHNAKRMKHDTISDDENIDNNLTVIGPNGTTIPKSILKAIDWQSTTSATRGLLMAVFDRETLAFHTLTGKRSPAFVDCDIPVKDQLDPLKVADIIHIVTKYCNVPERDVKMAITTKCADENKMYKQRQKRKSLQNK